MENCCIVGGGMNGLLLALALAGKKAPTPFAVKILEKGRLERLLSPTTDPKALALTPASVAFLKTIGLFEELEALTCPVAHMHITDHPSSALYLAFEQPSFAAPIAWIIEAHHLFSVLYKHVQNAPAISVQEETSVEEVTFSRSHVTLTLDQGPPLKTRLLVAADGRNSAIRQAASIETTTWEYDQSAIVATLGHTLAHQNTAWEHFYPQGPLAFLPLSENRSSLIWTETKKRAQELMALSEDAFLVALQNKNTGPCDLGTFSLLSTRRAWPLSLMLATHFVKDRLALLGDAAHGVHPLAGLGLNLGFKDCAALAEVIIDAARLGLDHGSLTTLERYQRLRRFDTLKTAFTIDQLNALFSKHSQSFARIRQFGLRLVNASEFLKTRLMEEASGL